jgi:hypothetical protein
LHPEAVAILRAAARCESELLDMPKVCFWDCAAKEHRVERVLHPCGGITPTVIEPWDDTPSTCLAVPPSELGAMADVRRIDTKDPMLLKTLHATSTKALRDGRKYRPDPLPGCFRCVERETVGDRQAIEPFAGPWRPAGTE